jgi:hypothetical protein
METADPTDLLSTQLSRPSYAFDGFNKQFIGNHTTAMSILLFSILFISIQMIKPAFIYNPDGSLRSFGIGTKNKTIVPMWLVTLLLAIISYMVVLMMTR